MEQLKEILEKYCLDMIVIPSHKNPNFIKFVGISADYSYLIIEKESNYVLTNDFDINLFPKNIKTVKGRLLELIKNKVVGIDINNQPYGFIEKLKKYCKLIDISEDLNQIRMKKTDKEIENIKQAIKITEEVLNSVYEIDVKKFSEIELKYYFIKKGCDYLVSPAFDIIVAFDENAVNPHPISGNRKPKKLILVDIGFKYNNYVSDITRTFILDRELKPLYKEVLNVQGECIDMIKEGVEFKEIDQYAKKKLKYLIHAIGHGIGLEVHEKPFVNDILVKNSVITIEPGYYKEIGIRVEDDILVKNKGKVLSRFPKEFDEVLL